MCPHHRTRRPPLPTLFPYTTLFRSDPRPSAGPGEAASARGHRARADLPGLPAEDPRGAPRLPEAGRTRRPAGEEAARSEEHTSELQSRGHLVCRLLLEKKKKKNTHK